MVGDRGDADSLEQRVGLGLVLLGIAAYAYPKPDDLDVAEPAIVTIGAVERLMRAAIAPLAKLEAVDGSIESYAASAAAAYERMPGLLVTDRGAPIARIEPVDSRPAPNPFLSRKVLPEYQRLLRSGRLGRGTDSTQIVSDDRDDR